MKQDEPYAPPMAPLAEPPTPAGRYTRGEKILWGLLLVNSLIGGIWMIAYVLVNRGQVINVAVVGLGLLLPLFGLAATMLIYRRPTLGLALGGLFYLAQVIGYRSPGGSWGLTSGITVYMTSAAANGVVVVNVFALVLVFCHWGAWILRRERRSKIDSA